MRTGFGLSIMVIAALLIALGSATGVAVGDTRMMYDKPMGSCELRFHAADIGGKGYLTERDLGEYDYGASYNNSRGRVDSKFFSMDENGDGKVTPREYCEWRAPVTPYPTRTR